MHLLRFLSPTALSKTLAAQLGVPHDVVSSAFGVIDQGVQAHTGSPFATLPLAQSVISGGGLEAIPDVVMKVVRDRRSWGMLAKMAEQYVLDNDSSGSVMSVLSRVSSLPLKGFDEPHEGLADFLERAVFPLALDAVGVDPCPDCGTTKPTDVLTFGDAITMCAVCAHVYED